MEEAEKDDFLTDETVRRLRDVFLIDNVFPVRWEAAPPPAPWYRRFGNWVRRSLGISRDNPSPLRDDDPGEDG